MNKSNKGIHLWSCWTTFSLHLYVFLIALSYALARCEPFRICGWTYSAILESLSYAIGEPSSHHSDTMPVHDGQMDRRMEGRLDILIVASKLCCHPLKTATVTATSEPILHVDSRIRFKRIMNKGAYGHRLMLHHHSC